MIPLIAAYSLIWHPTSGEVFNQDLRLELHVEDEDILFTASLTTKVDRVEADGSYQLNTTSEKGRIVIGSKELPESEGMQSVEKYDAKGRRLSLQRNDEDDFGSFLSTVTEFYPPERPIEFGSKWSHQIPQNAQHRVPLAFTDYTLVGEEGGNLRVDFKYEELFNGADAPSAEGQFYLDPKTFALNGYSAVARNVRMDEETPPGTMVITLRRSATPTN